MPLGRIVAAILIVLVAVYLGLAVHPILFLLILAVVLLILL